MEIPIRSSLDITTVILLLGTGDGTTVQPTLRVTARILPFNRVDPPGNAPAVTFDVFITPAIANIIMDEIEKGLGECVDAEHKKMDGDRS